MALPSDCKVEIMWVMIQRAFESIGVVDDCSPRSGCQASSLREFQRP